MFKTSASAHSFLNTTTTKQQEKGIETEVTNTLEVVLIKFKLLNFMTEAFYVRTKPGETCR